MTVFLSPRLSVVLPTYNCLHLMERHLGSLMGWIDLADELVVVDSRSTDGTLAFLRAHLQHPGLRVIERDPGLYASWNEGIAATRGRWIYISTAGDTIERQHLLHLLRIGEEMRADVVVSPPRFVYEDGQPHHDLNWPPSKVLREFGEEVPFTLDWKAAQYLAFQHCPSALLGSSASNLYRGSHLRLRPFPTEYGNVGDTGWIMRYAAETCLGLTPAVGSTFCIHDKSVVLTPNACYELMKKMMEAEYQRLESEQRVGPILKRYMPEQRRSSHPLWVKKHMLWHTRGNHFGDRSRWVGVTLAYLWHRGREILRDHFSAPTFQQKQRWIKPLHTIAR